MVHFKSFIFAVILLAALFSGCVGPQATPTPTPPPAATPGVTATAAPSITETPLPGVTPTGKSILIKLDSQRGFIPGTQTIQPGDEILWSNYDTETVTLISGEGLFVAQVLQYYAEYRYVFKTPGTYTFYLKENKNLTGTIIVSQAPAPTPTPQVTAPGELPPGTLFVVARMLKPAFWGAENYSLDSLQVQIYNQRNVPVSMKAQIVSGGQILEEKSFTLEREGSSYQFTNEKQHFINSTNVTLRLLIQGYQPVEYKFIIADSIS